MENQEIMKNINSIFKENKESAYQNQERWRMYGIPPQEFRNSTINPFRLQNYCIKQEMDQVE